MLDTSLFESTSLRSGEFSSSDRLWSAYRRSLGPTIQKGLEDPEVLEVYRNPDGKIWEDHVIQGRRFTGQWMKEADAQSVVELVADSVDNSTVGRMDPQLAAEMPDTGERFQALLPPLVEGISFNIRKRILLVLSLADYLRLGIITQAQHDYIIQAVKARRNIMISGGTGSGKTTLLNAVSNLPEFACHRILQVEDRREVQCHAEDIVRILTREANPTVTTQQAIVYILRKRPDRILVGEVREGAPALALAKASNTGHPGCLGTIHANSGEEAFDRMDEIIGEVSNRSQHKLIQRTLETVIQISRVPGVGFKVTEIREPVGYSKKKERYKTKLVGV